MRIVILLLVLLSGAACAPGKPPVAPAEPTFVGRETCAACHAAQVQAWTGSHHDLAMEEPTARSVRGRFDGVPFEGRSVTAAFMEKDGRFLIRTSGADGKPAEVGVAYTFGVAPLQQYLVPFPGGRFQAFGVAWDDRPAAAGGQRWYDLYPDQALKPGDPLHWTGLDQSWNYQCAECHSTNLRKGYDAATRTYQTTWSEIDVSCEACHGPGSRHVEWAHASAKAGGKPGADPSRGLPIRLPGAGIWAWDDAAGKPVRTGEAPAAGKPRVSAAGEVEACGRCHARRGVLTEDYAYGEPLLATHAPALLTESLYYPDGQIQDEVFEYGSFRQSPMFQAGVGCSDCHEPHSLKLRAQGDAVCGQCHSPAKYDATAHTGHPVAPVGAPTGAPGGVQCVDCHMPERTYMGVDRRRDHSLRIPRPDLTVRIGTPNACASCHADRPAAWAAAAVVRWHGPVDTARHYGEIFHAARGGDAAAAPELAALAKDDARPAIVRATALAELARFPGPQLEAGVATGASDREALVRYGAALALEGLPADLRIRAAGVLLEDPVLAVRAEAARWLAGTSPDLMTASQAAALSRAVDDFRATLAVNADRPEAQLNRGNLEQALGRDVEAESAYRVATELDPSFAPAWANLADATRARGDEAAAGAILRAALIRLPDDAGLHHAAGLARVRSGDLPGALAELERAAELEPDTARYAYVYGVALNSAGETARALDTLAAASRRHPADRDILLALATINRDA
ncbi:MAG: ammonia-forming cytochrome c nitrite reductase subunit c552, partial [Gammaproteobacteria bacterium]|nr:ammonia-forming cytochrome c nitrite reductase subunit c552 [Gammaproteobacteria bacterium]